MKTLSEQFVFDHRERWRRLRDIVKKVSRHSFRGLTPEEVREFPRLFRLTCKDLAEARMLKLSGDVIAYLNNIIGLGYRYLHHFPVMRFARIRRYLSRELPGLFSRYRVFLLLSAFLFLLPLAVSFLVVFREPAYATSLVGEQILEMMEESYAGSPGGEHDWTANTMAVSYYIQHNTSIAFFSFAAGILAGVGTVYFLVYNGIFLGAIAGYIYALGYGENFRNFVTAHSVFELSGLIVAGAAGLFLGFTIIKAGKYRRRDWINLQKGSILKLLAPAVFFLFAAASIEGILSPALLPYAVKAGVAALSAVFIIYSFFIHRLLFPAPAAPPDQAGAGGVHG